MFFSSIARYSRWLILKHRLPFLLIPPARMQWLFIVKVLLVVIATFAVLGWSITQAGGGGPVSH
jgi:nucleobase:cation symporter-1, NCS1 family